LVDDLVNVIIGQIIDMGYLVRFRLLVCITCWILLVVFSFYSSYGDYGLHFSY